MKQCVRCKEFKNESEFSWRNRLLGIRQKHCKACMKFFSQRHYQKNKEDVLAKKKERADKRRDELRKYVWNYLQKHPCVDCGQHDPRVLEFDHIDPKTKTNTISRMISDGVSLATLKAEIALCEVRCANCHRKKSYKDGGWYTG